MDVAFLLDKYFKGAKNVSIDVFDAHTLNSVYKDVVNAMTSHLEIEIRKDGLESVVENGFWQGTLVYMVLGTGVEIDPNQIVDHRTDVEGQFNETFVESSEIETLW